MSVRMGRWRRFFTALPAIVALLVGAVGTPLGAAAAPAVQPPLGRAPSVSPTSPTASSMTAVAPADTGPHALTRDDVAAFFDGMMPYAIDRGNIAGATIAVVADGKLLFAKGYGFSDVKTRAPVLPDQTLFRVGSISKLFTWTSVMQLVQAGKIDLDRNVNDYLDFHIPDKFGEPITMRDLMTHTAGFEDTISQSFLQKPGQLIPLREYLVNHIPVRIFPPGKVVAYSNYGATLAGYIVQRLSGEPFEQYVANHIYQPLGMQHSTFVQPLPPALAPDMSQGYAQASDGKSKPFEIVEVAPAGSVSASATDMARFMIAQLDDGSDGGAPILDAKTLALMHSPQSRMAPGMNGFDLGFYQENRNGLRIIGHAGDTNYFHSDLHLLLDRNVGIFMSFNSAGSEGASDTARTAVFRAFLDRYFPYSAPHESTVAHPQVDAARVAGWYESSRRITSALSIINSFLQTKVVASPDGTVRVAALTDLSGTPLRWREVGPLTYREIGGQTHLKFVADPKGRILYWISDDFLPVLIFQRAHGLRQTGDMIWMMSAFCVILLLTIILWPAGWVTRRRFAAGLTLSPERKRLRLASRAGAVLLLAMVASWGLIVMLLLEGSWGLDGAMIVAYCVSVLGFLGALAILVETVPRVWHGPGGWLVRSGEALLGLAALYGVWLIFAYGLINFSLRY
ncbi:MAG: serine hydrolase domain-containing protein [Steroidobacteraceae bacterium]